MLLTVNSSGRVLDLFTVEIPEWGVTQVAEELGFSKSKAHSLLSSLTEVGLLRRTLGGRYRLGWRLLGMNRVLTQTTEFNRQACSTLRTLSSHLDETVHLGTLDNGRVVYVNRVQSERSIPLAVSAVGSEMPAHCTGIGKALLSHLDEPELNRIVADQGLVRRTDATITELDELKLELRRIRERGYSCDNEECLPGVSCVAAPVIGLDGTAVAAISITAPTERFEASRDLYPRAVIKAARHVTRQLQQAEAISDVEELARPDDLSIAAA